MAGGFRVIDQWQDLFLPFAILIGPEKAFLTGRFLSLIKVSARFQEICIDLLLKVQTIK